MGHWSTPSGEFNGECPALLWSITIRVRKEYFQLISFPLFVVPSSESDRTGNANKALAPISRLNLYPPIDINNSAERLAWDTPYRLRLLKLTPTPREPIHISFRNSRLPLIIITSLNTARYNPLPNWLIDILFVQWIIRDKSIQRSRPIELQINNVLPTVALGGKKRNGTGFWQFATINQQMMAQTAR